MRLLFTTFLALVSLAIFSQSPDKINYQSIVRDLAGNVIQNQPIGLRMSILSDSINGTTVYQETFQPTTNNFGLVNIKIGVLHIPIFSSTYSLVSKSIYLVKVLGFEQEGQLNLDLLPLYFSREYL